METVLPVRNDLFRMFSISSFIFLIIAFFRNINFITLNGNHIIMRWHIRALCTRSLGKVSYIEYGSTAIVIDARISAVYYEFISFIQWISQSFSRMLKYMPSILLLRCKRTRVCLSVIGVQSGWTIFLTHFEYVIVYLTILICSVGSFSKNSGWKVNILLPLTAINLQACISTSFKGYIHLNRALLHHFPKKCFWLISYGGTIYLCTFCLPLF